MRTEWKDMDWKRDNWGGPTEPSVSTKDDKFPES